MFYTEVILDGETHPISTKRTVFEQLTSTFFCYKRTRKAHKQHKTQQISTKEVQNNEKFS